MTLPDPVLAALGLLTGKAITTPVWLVCLGVGMPWLSDAAFRALANALRMVI